MIRADKAYFLTHRGDVVGEDHPDRNVLLCKAGELLDERTARRVGLLVDAPALVVEAEATIQAVAEPPTIQAVKPPTRAKAKAKAKTQRT